MTNWRFQKGKINFGCIFSLIVMVVGVVVAINVVPPMLNMGEFQDEVTACADRANRREYTNKLIVKKLMDKAEQLRIPIDKDGIEIKRTKKFIDIKVEYTYNLEIVFYTHTIHKVVQESRPLY